MKFTFQLGLSCALLVGMVSACASHPLNNPDRWRQFVLLADPVLRNKGGVDARVVAFDPHHTNRLYIATTSDLYVSEDSGVSWREAETATRMTYGIHALVFAPDAPGVVLAATERGVIRSTDGGQSWERSESLTDRHVAALVIVPQSPSTLFAGTLGDGVFKSTDGGNTWNASGSGITDLTIHALAIDPQNPDTLYAGAKEGGIFKSTNGGETWSSLGRSPSGAVVRLLAIHPQNPSILFAAADGKGLFKSEDGGATWNAVNDGISQPYSDELRRSLEIRSLLIDPKDTSILYAGTNWGLFKSTDGGQSWSIALASVGLFWSEGVYGLTFDPRTTRTLFAATSLGVFISTDGGETWRATSLSDQYASALAVDAHTPSRLYVGTRNGAVFRSLDDGGSWQFVSFTEHPVTDLRTDPRAPDTVYAATEGGGVFKSASAGQSWRVVNAGLVSLDVYALAVDPRSPDTLYAGTGDGIFKSADGGMRWADLGLRGMSVTKLAIDPRAPDTLYAVTIAFSADSRLFYLFKSVDGGASWNRADMGLNPTYDRVNTLLIAPDGTLYAGTVAGLFKSADGGASWSRGDEGIDRSGSRYVFSLAGAGQTPATLYALTRSTRESMLFISTNAGRSWQIAQPPFPLDTSSLIAVAEAASGVRVYILGATRLWIWQ